MTGAVEMVLNMCFTQSSHRLTWLWFEQTKVPFFSFQQYQRAVSVMVGIFLVSIHVVYAFKFVIVFPMLRALSHEQPMKHSSDLQEYESNIVFFLYCDILTSPVWSQLGSLPSNIHCNILPSRYRWMRVGWDQLLQRKLHVLQYPWIIYMCLWWWIRRWRCD